MRIGLYIGGTPPIEGVLEQVGFAAAAGLDSVFLNQVLGWDAPTVAALAAREVPGIELGTAVVQTFPRHPITLASQALTVAAAAGSGRFTLGIGPSHPQVVEGSFGLSYERPARHIREYLSALMPLLRGEAVDYRGETVRAAATLEVPAADAPPVLLAALGPVMLRIAGELADGVVTTWATPQIIAEHVGPHLAAAATAAGRPAPRIAAIVSAAVTDDRDRLRRELGRQLAAVSQLPSYRELLDRQGLTGVHETALLGSEAEVAEGIGSFADAGVTDLLISIRGEAVDQRRTLEFLATLRRSAPRSGGRAHSG
ncbi:TIGR03564 family F420-dependent LLM class oxidoreductase [Nocardia higoensis]|uniref:TIGR03564 family F420-dependent LLM class oxidoreductase n=1 Tax=Nocardia higoensis TaxID=228599 RepID=UPI0002FB4F11|nr:TIGR03564 family F420-dependent LLM class oxidoreductase [Nocardia higoensis]